MHREGGLFNDLVGALREGCHTEGAGCSFQESLIADARLALLCWIARMMERNALSPFKVVAEHGAGRAPLPPALKLAAAIANDRNGYGWKAEINSHGLAVATPQAGQDLEQFARLPSWETVKRWAEGFMRRGWAGLVPKYKARDMRAPAWSGEFLKIMQRPQKPTVMGAHAQLLRVLPKGVRRPKYRTVLRWYTEKYSNLDKQRGRNVGSAMNPHKFAHARSSAGMLPGDEVHSDGWSTHFLAPHPVSGKFVKLEVWHSRDVATRYVYPPSVGLSESATVILGSIANVIAEDGVPAIWQTDNTGSVKNDRVEFDPVASIAARAGMTIVHNIAGNSQANGIAEEFGHYLDSRARDLATYQGESMDPLTGKRVLRITQKMVAAATREEALLFKVEAERIGKGLVFESYAQAVDWLKAICAEYNHRPHRSLPMIVTAEGRRHMTPAEMRARFIEQGLWRPTPMSVENLADLMHVHERKTVIRGCVSVFGQRYHERELDHINGETVLVAYDINDGTRVWVKTLDGNLICEAKFYETRRYRSMSFMELALEKRADGQQRRLQRHIDDIEAQRPGAIVEDRPLRGLELVTEEPPPRAKAPRPASHGAIDAASLAKLEDDLTGAGTRRLKVPNGPNERYAWYVKLTALAQGGEAPPPELQGFLQGYGVTRECRLVAEIFEDTRMDVDEYASGLVLDREGPRSAVV